MTLATILIGVSNCPTTNCQTIRGRKLQTYLSFQFITAQIIPKKLVRGEEVGHIISQELESRVQSTNTITEDEGVSLGVTIVFKRSLNSINQKHLFTQPRDQLLYAARLSSERKWAGFENIWLSITPMIPAWVVIKCL